MISNKKGRDLATLLRGPINKVLIKTSSFNLSYFIWLLWMLQIRTQTRQTNTRKLLMPNSGLQPIPATKAEVQGGFFKFTLNQKYQVVLQIPQPANFTYQNLIDVLMSMKIAQQSSPHGLNIRGEPLAITNNQKELIKEREKLDLAKCILEKEAVTDQSMVAEAEKEKKVVWRLKRSKLMKRETVSRMKEERDKINEQYIKTQQNQLVNRYIGRPQSRNLGSLRKISKSRLLKNPQEVSDSFTQSNDITQSAQIERKRIQLPPVQAPTPQIQRKTGAIFRISQKKTTIQTRDVVRRPTENESPYLERLINAKLK